MQKKAYSTTAGVTALLNTTSLSRSRSEGFESFERDRRQSQNTPVTTTTTTKVLVSASFRFRADCSFLVSYLLVKFPTKEVAAQIHLQQTDWDLGVLRKN